MVAMDLLDPVAVLGLSWATACGLYALHYLARLDRLATAREIARHGSLSETHLSKVLQQLRREGLVHSRRGQGYSLARPPESISILEIVRALEGPIAPAHLCLMRNGQCIFRATCPLSRLCRELSASILGALGGINLGLLPVDESGLPVCMERMERKVGALE